MPVRPGLPHRPAPCSRRGGPLRHHAPLVAALAVALLVAACSSSTEPSDQATPTTSAGTPLGTAPRTAAGTTIAPAPEGALPASLIAELQGALDTTVATYEVPGAAVAVYLPNQGSWIGVTGVADAATGAPVTAELSWPLRSITKSFTVTLLLQLVDDGEVSLDDTIGTYVDGVPDGDTITLRELANMSAGVADYTTEQFIDDFSADPSRIFTLDELNAYALAEPSAFAPGSRYVYVNTNTNLLGAVIERVTGQPFEAVLTQRILEPLGLTASAYLLDVARWTAPHAVGYQPQDGTMVPQADNLSVFGPAGSMVSSLEDQRVWAEALATGALLTDATQTARLEGHPLEKGPEYDQYALGIGEIDGWWGHTGEGFGFTALTMHDDESGATVVIFMNIAKTDSGAHPPTKLFRQIAQILAAR